VCRHRQRRGLLCKMRRYIWLQVLHVSCHRRQCSAWPRLTQCNILAPTCAFPTATLVTTDRPTATLLRLVAAAMGLT
jgi:hypothetical protein